MAALYAPPSLQRFFASSNPNSVSCVNWSYPASKPCPRQIQSEDYQFALEEYQSLSICGFKKQGAGLIENLRLIVNLLSCKDHRPRERGPAPPIVYYWLAVDTLPDLIQFIGLSEPDRQLSHCENDNARQAPWTELAVEKLNPGRLYRFYSAVLALRGCSREKTSHSATVESFMEFLKTQLDQGPRDRLEAVRMAKARHQLWHRSKLNVGVAELDELDKERQYLDENSLGSDSESDSESEYPTRCHKDKSETLPGLTTTPEDSSLHKLPIQNLSLKTVSTTPQRTKTLELPRLRSKRGSDPEVTPTLLQQRALTKPGQIPHVCSAFGDSPATSSPALDERSKDGKAAAAVSQQTCTMRGPVPSRNIDAIPKLEVSDLNNGDQNIVTSVPEKDASGNANQESRTAAAKYSEDVYRPSTRSSGAKSTDGPFFKHFAGKPRDLKVALHNAVAQMERELSEKCEEDEEGIYSLNIMMYRIDLPGLGSSR